MTDYSSAYHDLRIRVLELARSADPSALDTTTPATPEWRVRDVLAHLAGVCDDISSGNLEGVASDEWTGVQVDKRREWDLESLFADWEQHAALVEPMLNDLPPVAVGQMMFDATTHEFDIRGGLGAPGGRESSSLAISYDWAVQVLGERLDAHGGAPLRFETEAGSADVGTGTPDTTLRASRFDIMRAMTGRRSTAQVEGLEWDGAPRAADLLVADYFVAPGADVLE